jgi:uncharacterized spore protein YtfJ
MFGRKKNRRERVAESIVRTDSDIQAPDGLELIEVSDLPGETAAFATIAKLFDVYQPGVVFSEPTSVGDNTVITASEVSVGLGLGFGRGGGGDEKASGEGVGGGGGGGSAGRPVAAIIIGPAGVRVEPIVDVTKIVLAFLTTLGAMYMSWRAMRRRR